MALLKIFTSKQDRVEEELRLQAEERVRRRREQEESLLSEITSVVGAARLIEEAFEQLAEVVRRLIPFERVSLTTVDVEAATSTEVMVTGLGIPGRRRGEPTRLAGTVVQSAVASRTPVRAGEESREVLLTKFPELKPALDSGVRSIIAVPLVHTEQIIAALTVESSEPEPYSERHLELAERVGEHLTAPMANYLARESLKLEANENSLMAEIGQLIGSTVDATEIYGPLAEKLRELVQYNRLEVATLDLDAGTATDVHVSGRPIPGWEVGRTYVVAGTPVETAIETRSGVVRGSDSQGDESSGESYRVRRAQAEFGSIMVVPLVAEEQPLAAITFKSSDETPYSERDLRLVDRIGAQLSAALARSRENSRLGRRAEEESALADVGYAISATSDLNEAIDEVARRIDALVEFDSLGVALLDDDRKAARVEYLARSDASGLDKGATLEMAGRIADQFGGEGAGAVAAAGSYDELVNMFPGCASLVQAPVSSVVAAPLPLSGETYGLLVLASATPRAYSEQDLALVRRVASRIAGPIASSRFAAALRAEVQEHSGLAAIAEAVNRASDPTEAYEEFAEQIRLLVTYDKMVIAATNRERGVATVIYASDAELAGLTSGGIFEITGEAFDAIAGTTSPQVAKADSPEEFAERFAGWASATSSNTSSVMAVPLGPRDSPVATLVLSSTRPDAYSEADLALAERVASLISGVVAGERRSARLNQEVDEAGVIDEVGRIVATSASLQETFERVADELQALVSFDRFTAATIDRDHGTLTYAYLQGETPNCELGLPEPLSGTLAGEALGSGQGFILQSENPQEFGLRFPSLVPSMEVGLRSFMEVPSLLGGEVVGSLGLGSLEPNAYSERDLQLVERAASHLVGVIGPTRLREIHELETKELEVFAELGRVITSSVDIHVLYDRVAQLIKRLIPFDRIAIWAVDLQGANLVAAYVSGVRVAGQQEEGRTFPLASPAAALEGATAREELVGQLAGRLAALSRGTAGGLPSILVVPMKVGEDTVGMLSLRSTVPNAYTRADVALAERIATQIAGPVANGQLYVECKAVESAVHEVIERFDLAVQGSGDGLWDWKVRENEIWWSPRYKELIGYDDGERGNAATWDDRLHPDDRGRVTKALRDHLAHRTPYRVQYRLRTDSGEYRRFSDRALAVWDEDGRAVRMAGALSPLFDDVASGDGELPAPHDISAAVDAIEAFKRALLVQRLEEPEEQAKYVAGVRAAGERLTPIVGGLDTVSSVLEGDLSREKTDLSAIARSVVARLRKNDRERKVRVSIAKDLTVEGDASLLLTLMERLMENAWKFTAGSEKARIEVGSEPRDGETVYFVRDNGVGFDTARVERLFGLFQRLHPPGEFEGAGLGLAVANGIVQRHGGRIWAEAGVDAGATFYFTL